MIPNLAAAAVGLAGAGCLGGTQNPSYFPFYLPTGDIIPTHAKPPGAGYFHNFDPKACKVEVTPATVAAATRSQQILIATVTDGDGQARRKRRVEWVLDGPGSIIEVDESGYLPGRGYKVDNTYAVSYTDYLEHCITRGREVTIKPGQTWCVVSCPVPGQTSVTAYAPEVFDSENSRAFATITWVDGGPRFAPGSARYDGNTEPPAAPQLSLDLKLPPAAPLNGETAATIVLANGGKAESPAVTVRAVVPEGVALVRADPAPTRRNGRELEWAAGSVPGGGNCDVVLVLRPTQRGLLVLSARAETADGLRADRRASARVDTAGLRIAADVSPAAAVGGAATVRVGVTNTGAVTVTNAVAWLAPGDGLRHESGANPVEIPVGTVEPGKTRAVDVRFACVKPGIVPVRVNVAADGGVSERADSAVNVLRSELAVTVTGPEAVPVGDEAVFEVRVTNAGDSAMANAAARAVLPTGLAAKGEASWQLGPINANETKVVRLTVSGDRPVERGVLKVTASADGPAGGPGLTAQASAPVGVAGKPVLVMELADPPGPVAAGGRADFTVTVRNRGTGPATKVEVTVSSSGGLTPRAGTGPGRSAATIAGGAATFPLVDELPPGAVATYTLSTDANAAGDARVTAQVSARELVAPLRDDQAVQVRKR
jgi:uncharacterized repeat protein (TIGR01451 family)